MWWAYLLQICRQNREYTANIQKRLRTPPDHIPSIQVDLRTLEGLRGCKEVINKPGRLGNGSFPEGNMT